MFSSVEANYIFSGLILADLASLRKLDSLDNGHRCAPGSGNSMETPKLEQEGKLLRFTHIVSKV